MLFCSFRTVTFLLTLSFRVSIWQNLIKQTKEDSLLKTGYTLNLSHVPSRGWIV